LQEDLQEDFWLNKLPSSRQSCPQQGANFLVHRYYNKTGDYGRVAVIEWVTTRLNHTPLERCRIVSERFQKFYNQRTLGFLTVGTNNGYPVLCVPKAEGDDCSNIDEAVLITFKKGTNANEILHKLNARRTQSGPPVRL